MIQSLINYKEELITKKVKMDNHVDVNEIIDNSKHNDNSMFSLIQTTLRSELNLCNFTNQ